MTFRRHHIEELAELPEDRALEIHLSEVGWGRLLVWMRFAALVLVGWLAANAGEPRGWRDVLPLLELAILAGYFLARRRGLERRPFLPYGYALLVAQVALAQMAYTASGTEDKFSPFDFMLPGLLMIFPLPFGYLLALYGLLWLPLALSTGWRTPLDTGSGLGELIGYSFFLFFFFVFSRFLYRRRLRSFVDSWSRARGFALEGRRMRDELDQARRIQLSMLPQHDPYSAWLDIAGTSQPASEVGGDYYGFFELGESRQAVVVADVSGHGVASGLLLAGVRGCLVMLHDPGPGEEVPPPQGLLARLNRVVRTVGGRRTFVTMVYTLFQRSPPRLTLAAAGHPPLIRWRPGGAVDEIALPSLPLGTTLAHSFPQTSVELEPGEVLVFATDGIAEAIDPQGTLFGEERLYDALRRAALGATAAEIRDAILAELERFLGSGEVQDDVTLVVVRVKS